MANVVDPDDLAVDREEDTVVAVHEVADLQVGVAIFGRQRTAPWKVGECLDCFGAPLSARPAHAVVNCERSTQTHLASHAVPVA